MPPTRLYRSVERLQRRGVVTALDDGCVAVAWKVARLDDGIGSLLTYVHIASKERDWTDATYLFENRGDRQDALLPAGRHLHPRTSRLVHVTRYLFAASKFDGGRDEYVLDLACGLGYGAEILTDGRSGQYVGVDIADDAIAYARRHYERAGRQYVVGDGTSIPLPDDTVGAVASFETMEHVGETTAYLAELRRVTVADADLLVSVPYDEPEEVLQGDWNRSKDYPHLESYDYDKLTDRLEGVFPDARIEIYEQRPPDGTDPLPAVERREERNRIDPAEYFERRGEGESIQDDAPALVAHVKR